MNATGHKHAIAASAHFDSGERLAGGKAIYELIASGVFVRILFFRLIYMISDMEYYAHEHI